MILTEQKTISNRLQQKILISCAVINVSLCLGMIAFISVGFYQTHSIAGLAVIPMMIWCIFSIIKNTKQKLMNL